MNGEISPLDLHKSIGTDFVILSHNSLQKKSDTI